jgi:two-component system, OmpR family, response regulator
MTDATVGPARVPPHVLALDDDPDLRALLLDFLPSHEFRATAVATGAEILKVLAQEPIDVVLLDLRLPGEDGLAIARHVRETSKVPIIILSGRTDEADRVMGLELAADDYVTKPFSPRELVARIRAVLRRTQQVSDAARENGPRAYRFAGWELNLRLRRLTGPDSRPAELTNSEFNLLCAFLASPQRVLTRDQLLERSRLHSIEVYDRAIDVTILRLRRKIEQDHTNPKLILTERGAGYRFAEAVSVLR